MRDIITGLTDGEVTILNHAIDTINGILARFEINLTETERSATPALGDRRLHFTLRAFDYAAQYPGLMTGARPYTSFVRINRDWLLLSSFLRKMQTGTQALDDTLLIIGANFHKYANSFYKRLDEGIEDGIAGLTAVKQDLGTQYDALRGPRGNGTANDNGTDTGTDGKTDPNGGANPGDNNIPGNNPTNLPGDDNNPTA